MANHRKGPSRGTHSGLRRGTLPWRKDELILRRIALQDRLRAEGFRGPALLDRLNTELGADAISRETMYGDHARSVELARDEVDDAKADHLAAARHIKATAFELLEATSSSSPNRSSYLNTALRAEEFMAKLDGSLLQREEPVAEGDNQVVVRFVKDWDRIIDNVVDAPAVEARPTPRLGRAGEGDETDGDDMWPRTEQNVTKGLEAL